MLVLHCDRCGLSIELLGHLEPKSEETDGGDGQGWRAFWEISNEQNGITSNYVDGKYVQSYFDRDPQEFKKFNWIGGSGTPDEWFLNAHLCKQCKDEYRQYIKDFDNRTFDLRELFNDVGELSLNQLNQKIKEDKERYKHEFLTDKNTR